MTLSARTALLASLLSTTASADAPPPIEAFARMPHIRDVSISPAGRHVAFISAMGDASVVMTLDRFASSSTLRQVAVSEPGRFDFRWCSWANETRLLCGLIGVKRGRYAYAPFTSLIAVDANGGNVKGLDQMPWKREVLPFNPRHQVFPHNPQFHDRIVDITPRDEDTVLLQVDLDGNSYPSVYELNVNSGRTTLKVRERAPITTFSTDSQGNVRLGWGNTEFLNTHYFTRLEGEQHWRLVEKIKAFEATDKVRPLSMAAEKNVAYGLGSFEGRSALWTIDLTQRRPPALLFSHPFVDVGELVLTPAKRLIGIRWDVEWPFVYYTDDSFRSAMDSVDARLPHKFNQIVGSTVDEKTFLVHSFSDVDAGTYYVFDTHRHLLHRIATAYPELDAQTLGRMRTITYRASDGTEIPGYLTAPRGQRPENLPLIVMPHDGPVARDTWEFSFVRAFLASRGYAILQMNFRGSSGYGDKWMLDAHQDWGGLSYSDIADGARWAVAQGIADPKRICIAGWGFGGYAALLAAVRDTELFRCAISIAGISDLELQSEMAELFRQEKFLREQLGTEPDKLRRDSPLQHVEKVSIPILMLHGDEDWRVQIEQSTRMAAALERLGKPHRAVFLEDADHEFTRKSHRTALLTEIETFLRRYLPHPPQKP